MNSDVKKYIEKNADLLNVGDLSKLLSNCPSYIRQDLIDVLTQAGIDITDAKVVTISQTNRKFVKDNAVEQQVTDLISKVTLTETKTPKIMKRYFNKANFIRYDIGIGTAWIQDSDTYEKTVALPAFEDMKKLCLNNGWKAVYAPTTKTSRGCCWTDFLVQIRIPVK